MWLWRKLQRLDTGFAPATATDLFDLTTNYFELFDIEQGYQLNLAALKKRYLQLQKEFHPDNFASESARIQREAMQRASRLNQAYETLGSPLQRAIYLLQTVGQEFDADRQIDNDTSFLAEQLKLREALSEVPETDDPMAVMDELRDRVEASYKHYQSEFSTLYDEQNWESAAAEINKMMFAHKLLTGISEKEESLFD